MSSIKGAISIVSWGALRSDEREGVSCDAEWVDLEGVALAGGLADGSSPEEEEEEMRWAVSAGAAACVWVCVCVCVCVCEWR